MLQQQPTSQQSTLFAEGSLANPTALPGSVEAKRIVETYGKSSSASYKRSDPIGLLVKMFLELIPPYSPACVLTWRVKGIASRYLVLRQPARAHRTSGKDALLWPTPRASEWKDTGPVGSKSHTHMYNRDYLCAKVKDANQPTGKLSPAWVEWLMGFPEGWTDLEH